MNHETPALESVGEFRRRPESEPFFRLAKTAKQAMLVLSSIQPDAARRKKGRSKPDRILRKAPTNAFSLGEVIVALAIVSISLLGLLRLQLLSIAASEKANALTEAMLLAQSKIAETGASGFPALGTSQGSVKANSLVLQWQTRVTQSALVPLDQGLSSNLHKVTVNVSWMHGAGKKNVEMVTHVADRTLP
jgi:type II secretory pathway pseudopilin PulG